MKIAMLSIHSSPVGALGSKDTGGMSTYLLGLSRALGQAGHRVDLFTRSQDGGGDKVQELEPGLRLVTLDDRLGALPKLEIYPHTALLAANIIDFCRRDASSYQALFSHYWISGCVGRLLKLKWSIPHLIMFHTLGRAKNESCPAESEPLQRLQEEEALAGECDRIIVAAKLEKEKILAYFNPEPGRVSVIPCGVDRKLFQPVGQEEARRQLKIEGRKLILFVGRIEPVKGLDLLFEATGRLPAGEDFKLVIVGGDDRDQSLISRLKEEASRLGFLSKLHFAGLVDHEQLPLYYSAADLTVLPSHYESFGLAALESVACGTPVVAGPVGVIPELISVGLAGPFGCLVTDRDPATWANAFRRYLDDPIKIDRAAVDAGLARFSWPEIADRLRLDMQSLINPDQ